MLFLRHPAWLWLKKHDKDKLPPYDENTQAIFDAGFLFETYAEQLFPSAVKIGFLHDDNFVSYRQMPAKTKKMIESDAKTILQGRLEAGEATCIFDVIDRVKGNTFDLYEIKSSTGAKSEHIYDLAFQKEVIETNGIKINRIFVIHVNNKFVRSGEIKPKEIIKITDVTLKVKRLRSFTKTHIACALDCIKQKTRPDISPVHAATGAFGDWLAIYETIAEVDEYSIYHLISPAKLINDFHALGIKNISEIPEEFILSDKQRRQFHAVKHDVVHADAEKIKAFLSQIKYPLYFLDYETLSSVIPYYDGLGPYKQLPFQYSLHVLDKPGGKIQHFEYLHRDNTNPIKPLSDSLKSQIGDKGTVFVWFESFEKSCNELMGKIDPKYKKFYKSVSKRILDLMIPFADGHYVHKNFFGSASIKKVLPVIIPELSYKDINIQEGNAAQRLWMEAILHGKHDEKAKSKILADLQKYCELDTLAMVRIYEFLTKIK